MAHMLARNGDISQQLNLSSTNSPLIPLPPSRMKNKRKERRYSTAFKASSSKGKSKIDSDNDDPFDGETMALLVQKMGRFMKKRGYGARKRRDHMKSREMLCYNCNSPDHVVAKCPYEDKRYHDGS
jgi:hypothetical protein